MIFDHKVKVSMMALGTLEMMVGPFFFYGLMLFPMTFWVNLEVPQSRMSSASHSNLPSDSLLSGFFFIYLFLFNSLGLTNSWIPLTCWPVFVILLSFSLWVSTVLRWVSVDLISFLSHMTPSDLPLLGGPLMSIIEVLSSLIRPLTLGMRLCANISGGHLITELLEEMGGGLISSTLVGFYELFVCFMQSLIFSLLLLSYFSESTDSI